MEPLSWTGSIAFLNPLLMIALAVLMHFDRGLDHCQHLPAGRTDSREFRWIRQFWWRNPQI